MHTINFCLQALIRPRTLYYYCCTLFLYYKIPLLLLGPAFCVHLMARDEHEGRLILIIAFTRRNEGIPKDEHGKGILFAVFTRAPLLAGPKWCPAVA